MSNFADMLILMLMNKISCFCWVALDWLDTCEVQCLKRSYDDDDDDDDDTVVTAVLVVVISVQRKSCPIAWG